MILPITLDLCWGDGSNISFWHNFWCGDQSFRSTLAILYRISCMKEAYVAGLYNYQRDSAQWGVIFPREVDLFASFFDKLDSCRVEHNGVDKMIWTHLGEEVIL